VLFHSSTDKFLWAPQSRSRQWSTLACCTLRGLRILNCTFYIAFLCQDQVPCVDHVQPHHTRIVPVSSPLSQTDFNHSGICKDYPVLRRRRSPSHPILVLCTVAFIAERVPVVTDRVCSPSVHIWSLIIQHTISSRVSP
jgi:hypothetical protein